MFTSFKRNKLTTFTNISIIPDIATDNYKIAYNEAYEYLDSLIKNVLSDINKYLHNTYPWTSSETIVYMPPDNETIYHISDRRLLSVPFRPYSINEDKTWIYNFIRYFKKELKTGKLGFMVNNVLYRFPEDRKLRSIIKSLKLLKAKYKPSSSSCISCFKNKKKIAPIEEVEGGKKPKTNTYKILNCSIKFSRKIFTGTSITDVINTIATLLLPKIKSLTITITLLHMKTNKQYKYNLTYKFNKVNNLKLILNNHKQFLLIDNNNIIKNTTRKQLKYINKQTRVRGIRQINKLPYFHRIVKQKIT
jgi:hypothetical protein